MEITPSKCLANIAELFAEKIITRDQKLTLKYLVFLDFPNVFEVFNNRFTNQITEQAMIQQLILLANNMSSKIDRLKAECKYIIFYQNSPSRRE